MCCWIKHAKFLYFPKLYISMRYQQIYSGILNVGDRRTAGTVHILGIFL